MQYALTPPQAAEFSRIVFPTDARGRLWQSANDFAMAGVGYLSIASPGQPQSGYAGAGAFGPAGHAMWHDGVIVSDVRALLWARWVLPFGARADLERVNDALGAASSFVLTVTGDAPPLLARALECVGAELVPDARPAPAGLLAAIQRSGRLHIPLGGAAALRWIVRLIGGDGDAADIIADAMEGDRIQDALDLAHKAAGEDYISSVIADDGRLSIRWDGQWTTGRWASATVWRDPTPGCADLDAIIAWDEGDRDDDPRRGAGWSRHLDLPRAFGHLLAAATDLT